MAMRLALNQTAATAAAASPSPVQYVINADVDTQIGGEFLRGRLSKPPKRLGKILCHAVSMVVEHAHIMLRLREFIICSLTVPIHR
jgi:hypothetical protein